MPTTSNFGWTTPADTDLVKDGAAAIRTLGNGIDTSLVDLKGGTTGQVLSKASNTDLDFTWSSVDPLTILDAKGDLISATAADTPARLASSGINGDILTVDTSTATGLKWAAPSGGAGNLVQIATGTLSGASVTISSLSSYSELLLFIYDAYNATANGTTQVRINNNSTSNYEQLGYTRQGTNAPVRRKLLTQTAIEANGTQTQDRADAEDLFTIRFFNTKNAGFTSFDVLSTADNAGAGSKTITHLKGIYKVSEAVSSLVIYQTGGNWSGGTYTLYGG